MMKRLEIKQIETFNASETLVSSLNQDISKNDDTYPPVVVPPVVVSEEYLANIIDDTLFVINNIFNVHTRIFNKNLHQLGEKLKISRPNINMITDYLNDYWIDYIKKSFRPDIILTNNGHKFVEFNITSPIAGAGICDIHMDKFLRATNFKARDLRDLNFRTEPLALKWINMLVNTLLVTKKRVSTFPIFCSTVHDSNFSLENDFTLDDFREMLERFGFKYLIAPITELEITDKGVYYKGEEIDILFTDFTYSQYLEHNINLDRLKRLIDAHEKGLVMFFSPPGSMLFDNKAILSFLTDEQYRSYYDNDDDFERLQHLVAHTKIIDDVTLEFATENQRDIVLKPGFDFGGNGVHIGKNYTADQWKILWETCSNDHRLWVVQEYVKDQYIIEDPNTSSFSYCCLGPIFYNCEYAGMFYRDVQRRGESGAIINAVTGARYSAVLVEELIK